MARRVIKIDGDAAGLKTEAQSATLVLKAELEAQKKAVTAAKAEARRASKAASDVESQEARLAAKVAVDMENQKLAAKKKALAEATAAERAAAEEAKRIARETAAAQKAELDGMLAAARADKRQADLARSQAAAVAGATRTGASKGPSAAAQASAAASVLGVGPVGIGGGPLVVGLAAAVAALTAFVSSARAAKEAIDSFNRKITEATLTANERAEMRAESLRLGGINTDNAKLLAGMIPRVAGGRATPEEITAELESFKEQASGGDINPEDVLAIYRDAPDKHGRAGALNALSYGIAPDKALAIGQRYNLVTRGRELGRSQAEAYRMLWDSDVFKTDMEKADALAAAEMSGIDLSQVNGKDPFSGNAEFSRLYRQFRSRQQSAPILTRPANAIRTETENMRDSVLSMMDQTAEADEAREMRRFEQARLNVRLYGDASTRARIGAIKDEDVRDAIRRRPTGTAFDRYWGGPSIPYLDVPIDEAKPAWSAVQPPMRVELTNPRDVGQRAPMVR